MKKQNGPSHFPFWTARICFTIFCLGIGVSVEAREVSLFFSERCQEKTRTEETRQQESRNAGVQQASEIQDADEQEGPPQEGAQEKEPEEWIVRSYRQELKRSIRNQLKPFLKAGDIDGEQVESIIANLKTAIEAKSKKLGGKGYFRSAPNLGPKMRMLLAEQLKELSVTAAKIRAMDNKAKLRIAFEVDISQTTASLFLNQNLALTEEQSQALETRIRSIPDWQDMLPMSPIYYGNFGVDCSDVIITIVNEEFLSKVLREDQVLSFDKLLTRLDSLDRLFNQNEVDEAKWKEAIGDWISEVIKMKIAELDSRYSLSEVQKKKLEIAGKSLSKKFIELKEDAAKIGTFASRYTLACPPGVFVDSSRFWRSVVAKTLMGNQSNRYLKSMEESDAELRRNMCDQLVASFFRGEFSIDIEKQKELSQFVDQRVENESLENGTMGFVRAIAELPMDDVERIIGEEAMPSIRSVIEGLQHMLVLDEELESAEVTDR